MHKHTIDEMIVCVADALKLDDAGKDAVRQALTAYWHDKIADVWTAADVLDNRSELAKEEAIKVLWTVLLDSDAHVERVNESIARTAIELFGDRGREDDGEEEDEEDEEDEDDVD